MTKWRFLCFLLCAILVLSAATIACGDDDDDDNDANDDVDDDTDDDANNDTDDDADDNTGEPLTAEECFELIAIVYDVCASLIFFKSFKSHCNFLV